MHAMLSVLTASQHTCLCFGATIAGNLSSRRSGCMAEHYIKKRCGTRGGLL